MSKWKLLTMAAFAAVAAVSPLGLGGQGAVAQTAPMVCPADQPNQTWDCVCDRETLKCVCTLQCSA